MISVHGSGSWGALYAWLAVQSGLRRVVCDVYGTLLHVDPGPPDAASQWAALWQRLAPNAPLIPWEEMTRRLDVAVQASHSQAPAYHEVDWVEIFQSLGGSARLARHHARLQRRCSLMPGAAEFLRRLRLPCGLCSNAQAYTLMELRLALRAEGLRLEMFDPAVRFFSYQAGTAKPNLAIFQTLARATHLDPAASLLMVGDREDNDIRPAREGGWSTWLLRPA